MDRLEVCKPSTVASLPDVVLCRNLVYAANLLHPN